MMAGCSQMFESDDVRKFGSKDIYEKYLQFKMNIDVDLNPALKWCPRPNCMNYVEKRSRFQKTVVCACGTSVCLKCGEVAHPGNKCGAVDEEFIEWKQKNNCKFCPRCGIASYKFDGCNHMTCSKCKYQYCWICLQHYQNSNHWRAAMSNDFFKCPGAQYGNVDAQTVLKSFERQQRGICWRVFKDIMTIGTWPCKLAKEKPWFWLLAWFFLLISLPMALIFLILLFPISYPCRVCEGKRILNRLRQAHGQKIKRTCCNCCCIP